MRIASALFAIALLATQQATWSLSSAPALSIGTEDGTDATQLSRVYAAVRLPDNRIVVGNTGSSEMRFFDDRGAHQKSVGRAGSGPGEFAASTTVKPWVVGNRMYFDDAGNRRVNVFDHSGQYLRTFRFEGITEFGYTSIAATAGGFIVGTALRNATLQGPPGSLIEMKQQFALYDSTGRLIRTLFEAALQPRYVNEFKGRTHYPQLPLTENPKVVASATEVFLLRNDAAEIEVYSLGGQRTRTIKLPGTLGETRNEWPKFRASALASIARDRAARPNDNLSPLYQHLYESALPLRQFMPYASEMLMGGDGNIWIDRFHLTDDKVRHWEVISVAGKTLGTLTTPKGLDVYQIGSDFVLGKERDSLDVEMVRMYGLKASTAGSRD